MAPAQPDPYSTLGVTATASDEELRTAYRRLVQLHHPDHNHGSHESALRFAEIQEAYAHVKLLRKQKQTGASSPSSASSAGADPALDARLAAMEKELRAAQEQREKAARAAAQEAARAAAQQEASRPKEADEEPSASDEQLGYYTTDDSFSKILDDFAGEVSARFSEAHPPQNAPRKPRSVADWIDELGSRLTGDSQRKKDD